MVAEGFPAIWEGPFDTTLHLNLGLLFLLRKQKNPLQNPKYAQTFYILKPKSDTWDKISTY